MENGEAYLGDGRERVFSAFSRHMAGKVAPFAGAVPLETVCQIDPGYADWADQNSVLGAEAIK
jgi:hypothetical protein